MRAIRRFTKLLLLLSLLALAAPVVAGAGGAGPGWAVEPSGPDGPGLRPNFAYDLSPGQTIQDTVSISNLMNEEITFLIYPKDAYNTPRDAAFALQEDEEEPVDAASWITMGTGEYTLAPGKRVDIPFQLTVPANAAPGDHAAGIIAANANPVDTIEEDGVNLQIRQRVAARVYVRVDGPANPQLEVSSINTSWEEPVVPWVTGNGDATVSYTITNTGNVRLDGTAEVEVTGLFGRTVKEFDARALPELLPGASVVVTESWDGLMPAEPLTARVNVTTEDDTVDVSRTKGFFVWSWAVVALLLLLVVIGGWRWWRHRHPKPLKPAAPADRAPAKDEVLADA